MAKHVAYPLIIASIFFKVTADSAVALEKNGAIFNKDTLLSEISQDLLSGENPPPFKLLDSLESSDKADTQTEIIILAEGKIPYFTFLPLGLELPFYAAQSRAEELQSSPAKKRKITAPLATSPSRDKGEDEKSLTPPENPSSLNRGTVGQLHEQKWQENNIKKRPRTKERYIACFEEALLDGVYRSPLYDSESRNTHYYRRGMTPQKHTPRRRNNISLARKGKAPIWVNPDTDRIESYEMHHVGQANSETFIVQVTKPFHKHPSMHTAGKRSEINRSAFNTEKGRVRRILAEEWENSIEA